MKRMNVIAVVAALAVCTISAAGVRDAQWQRVRDAMSKGLPKSKSMSARGECPRMLRLA